MYKRRRPDGAAALLFQFADLEDFGAAVGADALNGRAAVFHRHLFGVFDLDLLALLDAVTLGHGGLLSLPVLSARLAPGREVDCGECNAGRGRRHQKTCRSAQTLLTALPSLFGVLLLRLFQYFLQLGAAGRAAG